MQGDAFKQVADTRAITFCVEREVALCSNVACALKDGDPVDVSWAVGPDLRAMHLKLLQRPALLCHCRRSKSTIDQPSVENRRCQGEKS